MSNARPNVSDVSTVEGPDGETDDGGDSAVQESDVRAENEAETDEAAVEKQAAELPIGVVFEVLKNERRRRTIRYLKEADDVVTLGEVSEHIAALENDKDVSQISYAERKRVYVGLYQCHLPKMDDMGIVDFNRARGRIELTPAAECLDEYLEEDEPERPWHQYYGALSVVGLLDLGACATGLLQVGALTALGPVVLGFVALSVAHAYGVTDVDLPGLTRAAVPDA